MVIAHNRLNQFNLFCSNGIIVDCLLPYIPGRWDGLVKTFLGTSPSGSQYVYTFIVIIIMHSYFIIVPVVEF